MLVPGLQTSSVRSPLALAASDRQTVRPAYHRSTPHVRGGTCICVCEQTCTTTVSLLQWSMVWNMRCAQTAKQQATAVTMSVRSAPHAVGKCSSSHVETECPEAPTVGGHTRSVSNMCYQVRGCRPEDQNHVITSFCQWCRQRLGSSTELCFWSADAAYESTPVL
jgi:hypothetical protein